MTGRHELPEMSDGEEVVRVRPDTTRTVEAKVVAAALVTLLASVGFAVLDAVAHNTSILDGLPEWARFVILAAIPPALAFLAGYAVPSNRVA